jgi:hypothetical protein
MKFALLGVDEDVWHLAQAIVARGEHEIAAIYEPGDYARELFRLARNAQTADHWETLALEGVVDVVIVGRGAPEEVRIDQLKKLVQAKVPVVALHPACEYIVGYELEMIRADVGGLLLPYYPGMLHPALRDLSGLVPHSEASTSSFSEPASIGTIDQLVFERSLTVKDRSTVLAQLARDADMIRQILGPIKQVSAMGDLPENGPARLSVQMNTATGIIARWSLEPVNDLLQGKVLLLGSAGKASCTMPQEGIWTLTVSGNHPVEMHYEDVAEGEELLRRVAQAIGGASAFAPAWLEVCRAAEVAETTPRCIRRGKTIELYNEDPTEESAFKGVMAVGGCLFLMLGLLLLFVVAIVEGLGIPLHRFGLWANWPVYLFAAFFVFLLLQLLRVFARGKSPPEGPK